MGNGPAEPFRRTPGLSAGTNTPKHIAIMMLAVEVLNGPTLLFRKTPGRRQESRPGSITLREATAWRNGQSTKGSPYASKPNPMITAVYRSKSTVHGRAIEWMLAGVTLTSGVMLLSTPGLFASKPTGGRCWR